MIFTDSAYAECQLIVCDCGRVTQTEPEHVLVWTG